MQPDLETPTTGTIYFFGWGDQVLCSALDNKSTNIEFSIGANGKRHFD